MTTLTGATFAGVVATAMLAAPAMACSADITGTPACDTSTGTFTMTWKLRNHDNITATLDNQSAVFKVKPTNGQWTAGTGKLLTTTVPADKKGQYVDIATQTGVPAGAKAKMKVHVIWYWDNDDRYHKKGDKAGEQWVESSETACGTCEKKETPPPAPGNGGGAGAPPAAKPPAAAPTLPVTGSQTGLYAGGAAVLVAAGAGLFVVARRRRVKFQA